MRILVTAGPTRERIDSVRFITNASSGRMGLAVAQVAAAAGHQVTFLLGPVDEGIVAAAGHERIQTVRFVSVDDLQTQLDQFFPACDALVMSAAVGDFRVESPFPGKISRRGGPVAITLTPTQDVLACVAAGKRPGQIVVAFAVETGPREQIEAKARAELAAKNADFVVVNTPDAMAAPDSDAAILSRDGTVLPWGKRPKEALAAEVLKLLED